ncbi:MAG: hypothetical protein J5640_03860 [Bacteroidales bacterium]|nr:hypothetical protein [Bacteroidales bacterium]
MKKLFLFLAVALLGLPLMAQEPDSTFLHVKADERGLVLTVKDSRKADSTIVSNTILPADISVPLRKKPYYVELHRAGQSSPAYRGIMYYDNPRKTSHFIQSWSRGGLQFVSFNNYFYGRPRATVGVPGPDGAPAKTLSNIGYLNLFKFSLFPGFSTSLLKGTGFLGLDGKDLYTLNDAGGIIARPNPIILPAISVILINGEFRVGGALLTDYADASILASYAWYPDIYKDFVKFSYLTGHDVFVGLELSSRIPAVNYKLKAGLQMYPGLKTVSYKVANGVIGDFMTIDTAVPNMFVVALEMSLGISKGENILRIF